MIVVDSSVWIALFRKQSHAAVERLIQLAQTGPVLVGDIVFLEVLQERAMTIMQMHWS
jgi:predicted nucleic acid-binding protein